MKWLGISRPIDKMGRVVIPRELRRTLGLEFGDRLEVYIDGDSVVLRKNDKRCTICGSTRNLTTDGKLCIPCIKKYKKEVEE